MSYCLNVKLTVYMSYFQMPYCIFAILSICHTVYMSYCLNVKLSICHIVILYLYALGERRCNDIENFMRSGWTDLDLPRPVLTFLATAWKISTGSEDALRDKLLTRSSDKEYFPFRFVITDVKSSTFTSCWVLFLFK